MFIATKAIASASAFSSVPAPVPNPNPTPRRSLPAKRTRKDSAFTPRKKASISSTPATSLDLVPASRRSHCFRSKPYRCSTRCRKNRSVVYRLAANRRKAFDRSFTDDMDDAIAKGMAMDAAAARVMLPVKRPRKVSDTALFAPPPNKTRISSTMKSSLTAESSESERLGSFWTIVPDRRGNMISVRRSHRLTRS